MQYIKRSIEETLFKAGNTFKAVLVTGPRQVGKSTVLKQLYSDVEYTTFDNPVELNDAVSEPGLFMKNHPCPIILDEVQYATDLFPYIKMECDRTEENGNFYLTGSQQFHLMNHVSESLAGRIAILELQGLSLREIQGISFQKPFIPTEEFFSERKKSHVSCDHIWEIIHRGSYPALQNSEVDWEQFYGSYVQTYIERDINELLQVKDKLKFTQFLTCMAARTGQLLNYASIADELELSAPTIKNWVSMLETSGIIYLLQPYSNSALNRAIKTPKVYFRDTGLVCFLTKWTSAKAAAVSAMAGGLFETFVISEILKSYTNAGKDYRFSIHYYRGKDKAKESEIDLIIEENGILHPIEIKMSANPKLEMTNAFDVLDKVPGKKRGLGAIICMYEKMYYLKENIAVVPVEDI